MRTDTSKSFGGEQGVGRAGGGKAGDGLTELRFIRARVVGDLLEKGLGADADGATGGDGEGDESGTDVGADFTILLLLLGVSGSEDLLDGLARVLLRGFVGNADIDGDGVSLKVSEDEVRALGARAFHGFGAGVGVGAVGVVAEAFEATGTVVDAEVAWFLLDVGVAGETGQVEEAIADAVVTLGDSTARDRGATDGVAHPFVLLSKTSSFSRGREGTIEIVGAAADCGVLASRTGVACVCGGGGLLRWREESDAEVSGVGVLTDTLGSVGGEDVSTVGHAFEVQGDLRVGLSNCLGEFELSCLDDVALGDVGLLPGFSSSDSHHGGSVGGRGSEGVADDAETTLLAGSVHDGLLTKADHLTLGPALDEVLVLGVSCLAEFESDVRVVDTSDETQGRDDALAEEDHCLWGSREFGEAAHLGIVGSHGAGVEVLAFSFVGSGDAGTEELDAGGNAEHAETTVGRDGRIVESGGDLLGVVVADKTGHAELALGEVE